MRYSCKTGCCIPVLPLNCHYNQLNPSSSKTLEHRPCLTPVIFDQHPTIFPSVGSRKILILVRVLLDQASKREWWKRRSRKRKSRGRNGNRNRNRYRNRSTGPGTSQSKGRRSSPSRSREISRQRRTEVPRSIKIRKTRGRWPIIRNRTWKYGWNGRRENNVGRRNRPNDRRIRRGVGSTSSRTADN